jgi:CheY-like chemotaxis protein
MGESILVLEDEPDVLNVVCTILEDAGYNALGITSPDRVEEALGSVTPNLFLMDIMLQGRSGIDVARALRAEGFPKTPMIAMSASPAMAGYARSSGVFDETIDKPFDLSHLLETVERHLQVRA